MVRRPWPCALGPDSWRQSAVETHEGASTLPQQTEVYLRYLLIPINLCKTIQQKRTNKIKKDFWVRLPIIRLCFEEKRATEKHGIKQYTVQNKRKYRTKLNKISKIKLNLFSMFKQERCDSHLSWFKLVTNLRLPDLLWQLSKLSWFVRPWWHPVVQLSGVQNRLIVTL